MKVIHASLVYGVRFWHARLPIYKMSGIAHSPMQ